MDKITRIHIAKIPYEIDADAEAALQKYLHAIRHVLDADLVDETMTDIEVRITEILSERKIRRNDVITLKDIIAIQGQLGSPGQFNSTDSKSHKTADDAPSKRLLRDPDNALIGGVCSGLGAYSGIDANIIRVVFVALIFASGLGILLYILLWILVPAAKTNSDKLLMRGEPVTAEALQRYRNTAQRTISNLKLRRIYNLLFKLSRLLLTAGGLAFILAVLVLLGLASAALYTQPLHPVYAGYRPNYLIVSLVWLFFTAVIGLIIVMMLRLWQKRRLLLKPACFTLLGIMILTIAGLSVVSPFAVSHYKNIYGDGKLARTLQIAGNAGASPQSLDLQANSNLEVSYMITSQPIHATYQSYPGMHQPKVTITSANGTLTVRVGDLTQITPDCVLDWCKNIYLPVKVDLYGPALQKYTVDGAAELDLDNFDQTNLTLIAKDNAQLNVNNGYSDTLNLLANTDASINTDGVTAKTANVSADSNSSINAPSSDTLNATFPTGCYQPVLFLNQDPITATINGQAVTITSLDQNACVNSINDTPPSPPIPPAPKPAEPN